MNDDRLGQLAELARGQHGVVSATQAAALGLDRRRMRRAEVAGMLVTVHPQVYRFAAVPVTDHSAAMAAVLQVPRSVASAQSALRLHGVTSAPAGVAVSTDDLAGRRCDGVSIHRVSDLLPAHLDTKDGVPTTTVERAVV